MRERWRRSSKPSRRRTSGCVTGIARSEGETTLEREVRLAADAPAPAVRPARARSLRGLAVGTGTAAMLAAFAFASGGYFPTAWGWGALIALWVTATYLVLGTPAL